MSISEAPMEPIKRYIVFYKQGALTEQLVHFVNLTSSGGATCL